MRGIPFTLIALLALLRTSAFAEPTLPIRMTAHLERSVREETEPVTLTLTLHNEGSEPVVIGGSVDERASFDIAVTDSAGRRAPRTAAGDRLLTPPMACANIMIMIAPGQTRQYRFNLARLFEMSRAIDSHVSVSRRIWTLPTSPLPRDQKLLQTVLAAGPLAVRMTEDAAGRAGEVAVTETLPQHWGKPSGGLAVSIQIPHDVQPATEPMMATVVLKNVTSHPISLGVSGKDMTAFRLVLSGPGPWPSFPSQSRLPATVPAALLNAAHDLKTELGPSKTPIILPPGGQRQYQFPLSRLADLTTAGNYTIQILRDLPDGKTAMSSNLKFQLTDPSNEVIFDWRNGTMDIS